MKNEYPYTQLPPFTVGTIDPANTEQYDPSTVKAVWEKTAKEFGFFFFKRDQFGDVIAKHDYGKKSQYGWVIVRKASAGTDGTVSLDDLYPVHWNNIGRIGEVSS